MSWNVSFGAPIAPESIGWCGQLATRLTTSRIACAAPPDAVRDDLVRDRDRRRPARVVDLEPRRPELLARVARAAEVQRHLALDELAAFLGQHHVALRNLRRLQDQVRDVGCRSRRSEGDRGEGEGHPHA